MSGPGNLVKRSPRVAATVALKRCKTLEKRSLRDDDENSDSDKSDSSITDVSDSGQDSNDSFSVVTDSNTGKFVFVSKNTGESESTLEREAREKAIKPKKASKAPERETLEELKGDTAIKYFPTRRGGLSVLFRSYFFRISRKKEGKAYYRCQTLGCKTTLVIENDLFKVSAIF